MRDVESVEWAARLMADMLQISRTCGGTADLRALAATVSAVLGASGHPHSAAWRRLYESVDAILSRAADASAVDRTGALLRLSQFRDENEDLRHGACFQPSR